MVGVENATNAGPGTGNHLTEWGHDCTEVDDVQEPAAEISAEGRTAIVVVTGLLQRCEQHKTPHYLTPYTSGVAQLQTRGLHDMNACEAGHFPSSPLGELLGGGGGNG